MHKPIPTEYRGIVFDSKSEAVFARSLHLAGNKFLYHPNEYCGHVWDFVVPRGRQDLTQSQLEQVEIPVPDDPEDFIAWVRNTVWDFTETWSHGAATSHRLMDWKHGYTLVEYKPSRPTDTYVKNLQRKLSLLPMESVIIYGNPWSDGVGIYNAIPLYSYYSANGKRTIQRPESSQFANSALDRCDGKTASYWYCNDWKKSQIGIGFSEPYIARSVEPFGIRDIHAQQAKGYRFDLSDIYHQTASLNDPFEQLDALDEWQRYYDQPEATQ